MDFGCSQRGQHCDLFVGSVRKLLLHVIALSPANSSYPVNGLADHFDPPVSVLYFPLVEHLFLSIIKCVSVCLPTICFPFFIKVCFCLTTCQGWQHSPVVELCIMWRDLFKSVWFRLCVFPWLAVKVLRVMGELTVATQVCRQCCCCCCFLWTTPITPL